MHVNIFTFSVNIFQGNFGVRLLEMVDGKRELLIKYLQMLMDSLHKTNNANFWES